MPSRLCWRYLRGETPARLLKTRLKCCTVAKPVREAMGGGAAIIPSTKKIGGPGSRIDIPFFYKEAALVFDYLDAMEVGLPDAPRADEILLALAMTDGPRYHARVPGLTRQKVIGEDGMH